jgi:hypothetical protein
MSIEPLTWNAPISDVIEAINIIAEKAESDPVMLLATTLAVVLANDLERLPAAVRAFDHYGLDLVARHDLLTAAKADRLAADAARRYRQQQHIRES